MKLTEQYRTFFLLLTFTIFPLLVTLSSLLETAGRNLIWCQVLSKVAIMNIDIKVEYESHKRRTVSQTCLMI